MVLHGCYTLTSHTLRYNQENCIRLYINKIASSKNLSRVTPIWVKVNPTESLCDPMRVTSEQNNVKEDSTSVVSSLLLIYS